MNKYSIILPVYNGGEYVKQCVKSVLSQSLQDFDLLVLDNCSTDGTTQWITSLKDKRIKIYVAESFLSMEENWKRIISIPKNEFMTIIGHDDSFHSNYLAAMDMLIEKHPRASLYQSHFQFIDAAGGVTGKCKPMAETQSIAAFMESIFTHSIDTMGTGYMMRASDYNSIGGIQALPNLLFADHQLWFNLTALSYKATTIEESFSYRLHQNTSKLSGAAKYIRAFTMFMDYLTVFRKKSIDIDSVIRRHIPAYIGYYCRSLSHRLLKTPVAQREGMTVDSFLTQCRRYADVLSPGHDFVPHKQFSIRLAKQIDNNVLLRNAYLVFKKLYKKPIYS